MRSTSAHSISPSGKRLFDMVDKWYPLDTFSDLDQLVLVVRDGNIVKE